MGDDGGDSSPPAKETKKKVIEIAQDTAIHTFYISPNLHLYISITQELVNLSHTQVTCIHAPISRKVVWLLGFGFWVSGFEVLSRLCTMQGRGRVEVAGAVQHDVRCSGGCGMYDLDVGTMNCSPSHPLLMFHKMII